VDTTLCQQCSEELLAELKRTLTAIPENSVLLLTSSKPDGRLKSTQLLQSLPIREFSLIPPWKTEQLQRVQQVAQELGIKLTQRRPTLWQSLLATIRDNFTVNWKIAYFCWCS